MYLERTGGFWGCDKKDDSKSHHRVQMRFTEARTVHSDPSSPKSDFAFSTIRTLIRTHQQSMKGTCSIADFLRCSYVLVVTKNHASFQASRSNFCKLTRTISEPQMQSPSDTSSRLTASEMLSGKRFITTYRCTFRSSTNCRQEISRRPTILVSAAPLVTVPRLLLLATENVVFQYSIRFTLQK